MKLRIPANIKKSYVLFCKCKIKFLFLKKKKEIYTELSSIWFQVEILIEEQIFM